MQRAVLLCRTGELRAADILDGAATLAPVFVRAVTDREHGRGYLRAGEIDDFEPTAPDALAPELREVILALCRDPRPVSMARLVVTLARHPDQAPRYLSLRAALDSAKRGIWRLRGAALAPGRRVEPVPRAHLRAARALHLARLATLRVIPSCLRSALRGSEPWDVDLIEAALLVELHGPTALGAPILVRDLARHLDPRGWVRLAAALTRRVEALVQAGVLATHPTLPNVRLHSPVLLAPGPAADLYAGLESDTFDAMDIEDFGDELDR